MAESSIRLMKKAGGSVIDHKPLFSTNSKTLYVGCGPVLRSFSTDSGEHVQDINIGATALNKPGDTIVDICQHPFDKSVILVCYEEGRVISWSFEMNTIVRDIAFDAEGCRVIRMKLHVDNEEYESFSVILGLKIPKCSEMKLVIYDYNGTLKYKIPKRFDFLMHSWSVTERGGKQFLAGIHSNTLTIFNLKSMRLNRDIYIRDDKEFVTVVCHPLEECVAVGDSIGRIILYYDFLNPNNRSPHHVYHWHTLPLNDVVFSRTGGVFYSGGSEHVLVKWNVNAADVKHFLPRLAAPIVHITVSPDNQFVAVSTVDNGWILSFKPILIVNSRHRLHCTLQQFTWGYISVPGQKMFPAGFVIDPRSSCLVMNGRPGHIQFYSPQYSSLMYNMDIVCQNYVSQERYKTIYNAEVVAIQFSSDGMWLVTAQMRDDPEFRTDTLLKFWLFNQKLQTYKLTGCITLNHNVLKIIFQPLPKVAKTEETVEYNIAVMCSDNKFRFWSCEYDFKGRSTGWHCYSIGHYRDHPIQDICFCNDGSLLGAAFGPCLTLWDVHENVMKCSLAKSAEPLRKVAFAHEDGSFIVIASTENSLMAWDVLSLSLLWKVELRTSLLVADPRTDHVAAFSPDNSVYIFKASSAKWIFEKKKLCGDEHEILGALFFPVADTSDIKISDGDASWVSRSSLYFFTSAQELLAFEFRSSDSFKGEALPFISEQMIPTPFRALMACQTASAVEKTEAKSHLQLGMSWSQTVAQFVNSPAHAMPPVHLLCEPLLRSLLISKPIEALGECAT